MSYEECFINWRKEHFFAHNFPANALWSNWTSSAPPSSSEWPIFLENQQLDETTLYGSMMEKLYYWGGLQTQIIQNALPKLEDPFISISSIFDPANIFMWLFPVVYFINVSLSIKLVVAASVTEWVNLCLKWMLHEHRPYSWAGENKLIYNIDLKQTEITCETGPGSPSGHVMANATVYYLLVKYIADNVSKRYRSLLWTAFYSTIFFIAISRVYIAAHFPHQVIFGLFLGIIVAKICDNTISARKWTLRDYIQFCSFLLLSGLMSHWIVGHIMKIDPERSVKLAKKWCSDPTRVHANTTPFFGFMRLIGIPLGLGLGLSRETYPKIRETLRSEMPFYKRIITATVAYAIGKALFQIPGGSHAVPMCVFALIRYALFAFIVSFTVPRFICGFTHGVNTTASRHSSIASETSTSNQTVPNGKSKTT